MLLRFDALPWQHRDMAEIVNLRRVKKARARRKEAAEAAANRARHGRTREERAAEALDGERRDRALDGARLSRDGELPE
jgi:hypothetical protein